MLTRYILAIAAAITMASPALAQFPQEVKLNPHTHIKDVIYHRKDGVALTMDVFTPKVGANGAGVIMCISAEYRSGKDMLDAMLPYTTGVFLNRGYVVFMVTHSSQPKFTVPEIVDDMHRAVRFIKANAQKFNVSANRLGITGASSGGQLSLMMGCAGKAGDPASNDPVEKETSKVAAVACIFPVTDFLEYDKEILDPKWEGFRVLFDIREVDPKTKRFVPITSEQRTRIGKQCSPLHCEINNEISPTFIVHGVADDLVPIHQSRKLDARLSNCGAKCQLVEVPGMRHRVIEALPQLPILADWFDKELLKKK